MNPYTGYNSFDRVLEASLAYISGTCAFVSLFGCLVEGDNSTIFFYCNWESELCTQFVYLINIAKRR